MTAATTVEEPGTPADTSAALELRGITVRFGGITALSDVDLTVGAGEVLGLIGPNGAGKTTLFDVISGIRAPTRARCASPATTSPSRAPSRVHGKGLRRTFQRVQTFGWLTVEDNVLSALEWHGGGGGVLADLVSFPTRRRREKARRERAADVIERCGLTSVRKRVGRFAADRARRAWSSSPGRSSTSPASCSSTSRPPASTPPSRTRLGERIQEIRSGGECAVVLVEHDVGFVMEHSDRITVLDLGSVLAVGEPAEIKADPRVRAAYLGEA